MEEEIKKVKRLLTDKEFNEFIQLGDKKKQDKYLDKIKEELWQSIDQKKDKIN